MRPLALLAVLALVSCAAPASDQGQGGSTGGVPTNQTVINFNGPVHVESLANPTAAPASSAQATQTATNDVKPAVGTDAIKAVVPVLNAAPAPAPVVAPAPVEPPR